MTTPNQMKINRDRKIMSTLGSAVIGITNMAQRQHPDDWAVIITGHDNPLGNLFWFVVNLHYDVYMHHMALPSPESFK